MVLQIKLTDDNRHKVDDLARRTGKTPEAIVNEAIGQFEPKAVSKQDWREAWRQAAGMWKDRDDIPELMAELRREMNRVEPPDEPLE
jgi:predicted transcriptional regulator